MEVLRETGEEYEVIEIIKKEVTISRTYNDKRAV